VTYIPVVRLTAGTIVAADPGPGLVLNVDGAVTETTWNRNYIPQLGDSVKVLIVDGSSYVMGPVGVEAPPLTGVVSGSASLGVIPVTTDIGTVHARYTGSAQAIGTVVRLDWSSTTPWIWPGAVASMTPPAPVVPLPPAPPPSITSGVTTFNAFDSGSYQVGGTWGWAGYQPLQYRYGSNRENRGAWFYGGAPSQLAGALITRMEFRSGARLRIGNYNNVETAHFYRHANNTRPSGDVTRTAGPYDVSFPPGAGPLWFDLPASFGQAIVDGGGGLGLFGAPYMGFAGIDSDAASGQIRLHWQR
jgi:hypothetical protein